MFRAPWRSWRARRARSMLSGISAAITACGSTTWGRRACARSPARSTTTTGTRGQSTTRSGWLTSSSKIRTSKRSRLVSRSSRASGREFQPRHLATWKRWLARNDSANWATTDAICGSLIGPLLSSHPELIPRVRDWSRHRNMWVRRASAVGLIKPMSDGYGLDAAYAVARALRQDGSDLIQKAVGWMLREAGKYDQARLERYLRQRGPSTPRTTVRYAIERFPPARRRALLAATRKPLQEIRRSGG